MVADQREKEEIEEHVKSIHPKVLPDFRLVFAPRKKPFQREKEQ